MLRRAFWRTMWHVFSLGYPLPPNAARYLQEICEQMIAECQGSN